MKISTTPDTLVESSGAMKGAAFTIRATGKAFRAIADGIYSDKVLAVLRELTANAVDAHAIAGKPTEPVSVHLPNNYEPFFSVRDFGTGISPDFMLNRYTALFDSSKNDDNTCIGGFGVGRLSALSYTDAYTAVSVFDGVKTSYAVFYNDEGLPDLRELSSEPTTEANGFEVSIPVKSEDFNTFHNRASKLFMRYSPQPNVVGVANFCPDTFEARFSGPTGWRVRRSNESGIMAIMGNIAYPARNLNADLVPADLRPLLNCPLDIDFEIGELEPTLSRESLSFTNASIENFVKKLAIVKAEAATAIADQIAAAKNMWAAKMALWDVMQGDLSCFRFLLNGTVTWNNQPVSLSNMKVREINGAFIHIDKYYWSSMSKVRQSVVDSIAPHKNVRFMVNDLKVGTISRVRAFVRANDAEIMIVNLNGLPESDFLAYLGKEGDTLERSSTLPRPVRGVGSISDKGRAGILELAPDSGRPSDSWEVPAAFDINAGGVYIPYLSQYYGSVLGSAHNGEDIGTLLGQIDAVFNTDLSSVAIVGVKNRAMAPFLNNPKWKTLDEVLKESIEKGLKSSGIEAKAAEYAQYQQFSGESGLLELLQKVKPKDDNSVFSIVKSVILDINKRFAYKNYDDVIQKAQRFCHLARVAFNSLPVNKDAENAIIELKTAYPMLTAIDMDYSWSVEKHVSTINDYINLVDALR